ncbi:MAG: DNA repair protein RecO [Gemmatimonadetes bacterium]|nr:DNA repair protein RecO [Gemmatimonadota bacterium]
MRLLETDALVLHVLDYRETSRIVRMVTRDAGVVSVVAKGARRPRNRFGAALDLFASGPAVIALHATGDLHALNSFEATKSRAALVGSLDRFAAASAVAELCLRFGHGAEHTALLARADEALDALSAVEGADAMTVGLAASWRIVAELGFGPTVESCSLCHRDIASDADVRFQHRSGGVVCDSCAASHRGGRQLPAAARAALAAWLQGAWPGAGMALDTNSLRAHLRLMHEFLAEHLGDGAPLSAFGAWQERATRAGAA